MKKVITLLIILFLIIACVDKASAKVDDILIEKSTDLSSIESRWYESEGGLKYCDVSNAEIDKTKSVSENMEQFNLPHDILKELTTLELVELLEQYPYLSQMYISNSLQEGFEELISKYNVLGELVSRSDCGRVVLDVYKNYKIPSKTIVDYSNYISEETEVEDINYLVQNADLLLNAQIKKDAQLECVINILELLLGQPDIQQQFDRNGKSELVLRLYEKEVIKTNSEYFSSITHNYTINSLISNNNLGNLFVKYDLYWSDEADDLEKTNNTYNANYYVIYGMTPSGNRYKLEGIYEAASNSYPVVYSLISNYKGATLVDIGNDGYNCHAYAWLSGDEKTSFNLYDVSPFLEDPYYKKRTIPYYVGNRVYFSQEDHSAVVNAMSMYTKYIYKGATYEEFRVQYISKWGAGPLVKHFAWEKDDFFCPYSGTMVFYK